VTPGRPLTRSEIMARVPQRDSVPEVRLRKRLFGLGYRYRLHDKRLPGRPDIVFPRSRVALFVHGCYWHRHPGCRKATTPATNVAFWADKFAANVARDARNEDALRALGWTPAVVWQCEIERDVDAAVARVAALLLPPTPDRDETTPAGPALR